jgi:hypothetical protein
MELQSTNGGTAAQSDCGRAVPARTIPVPISVSAELQKVIALPLDDVYRIEPKTREEWQAVTAGFSDAWAQPLPAQYSGMAGLQSFELRISGEFQERTDQ